jgi:hypothetical protein
MIAYRSSKIVLQMVMTVINQNYIYGEVETRLNLGNDAAIQFRIFCFPICSISMSMGEERNP